MTVVLARIEAEAISRERVSCRDNGRWWKRSESMKSYTVMLSSLFVGACVSTQTHIVTENTENLPAAASLGVCTPVESTNTVVFQAVAPFYESDDANHLMLVGPLWGQQRGQVVFFHDGRIAGRGTLDEKKKLYAHTPIEWHHEEGVWGVGGDALLPRLSDLSVFDAPLQMIVTNCDPSEFLHAASLDVEGDGVVDVEFGWRACPSGGAFEVRARTQNEWEILGRWIQPWHEGEGRPACARDLPGWDG